MTHSPDPLDPRPMLRAALPELADATAELRKHDELKSVWMVGETHVLRAAGSSWVQAQMQRERELLERLAGRTRFAIPHPLYAAEDGSFDVLERVPGDPVSWEWWPPLSIGAKCAVARAFGEFIADLHTAVPAADALALGIPEGQIPPSFEWVRERIDGRLETPARQQLFDALAPIVPGLYDWRGESVLLHDDLSHHNAAFDADSGAVCGFFDFTAARVGDPHRDLRYAFTFEPVAELMITTYEAARGVVLDRARLRAFHVWSAFGALAWDLSLGHEVSLPLRWGWIDHVAQWDRSYIEALR